MAAGRVLRRVDRLWRVPTGVKEGWKKGGKGGGDVGVGEG
jgi:hypothetical protein